MNQRLGDLLQDRGGNYLLPFFWQHGEEEAVLREEMARIHGCGIGAVCVEARPHPDFAGPLWWRDMDIVLDEARARGMKVWILDDAHFPTGYANGLLKSKPDALRKRFLMLKNVDVCGPMARGSLDVGRLARTVVVPGLAPQTIFSPKDPQVFSDDRLFAVVAARVLEDDRLDPGTFVDLTASVVDGLLAWDVPAGLWRVFVLYLTRNGGGRTDYVNVLDRASCAVLIEAVHEPHYAHYAADFGTTIAGFFSDEPLVGNTAGFDFDESIGKKMPLPWSDGMPARLEEAMGGDWILQLPLLWMRAPEGDPATARARYAYMDVVTRLIEVNFSRQLGDWCTAHGVEYIGHVIEDNNQHSRLGCSLGHFFRSMGGMHMAGIDDIGAQVVPGWEDSLRHKQILGNADGEFFHFALGKLGASLGHIDPRKRGRTMCECFGAYGWGEGVREMKWIVDHFLVRGVNRFVPHAFSAKEFPDDDCPPHFYARGQNPQYRHFGQLMRYANRMCHLLDDGRVVAPAALLYHGESEWTGRTQFLQKPARVLTEHQIDFDVLPSDVFADRAAFGTRFTGGCLEVNGNRYRCLVVPTAEYITSAVAGFAREASAAGFPVVFIDALPTGVCDADVPVRTLEISLEDCLVTSLAELPAVLDARGVRDFRLSRACRPLRALHYVTDTDLFVFFNESLGERVDVLADLPVVGDACFYDATTNALSRAELRPTPFGSQVRVVLEPYESCVLVFGPAADAGAESAGSVVPAARKPLHEMRPVPAATGDWTVTFGTAAEYPHFRDPQVTADLPDFAGRLPLFSGTVAYETTLTLSGAPDAAAELVLAEANEAVEAWVNGEYAGMRLCPPYRFPVGSLLQSGANDLRIEVTNTLANRMKPFANPVLAMFTPPEFDAPVGLRGPVRLVE